MVENQTDEDLRLEWEGLAEAIARDPISPKRAAKYQARIDEIKRELEARRKKREREPIIQ